MAGVFASSRPGLGEIRQSVEEGVPTSRLTRVVVMAVLAVGLSADVAAAQGTADLSITKTADQKTVKIGETMTYTITLTNLGPDEATDVVFGDPIPDQLNLVSSTCGDVSAFCTVASLESGASVSLTAAATPIANLAKASGASRTAPSSRSRGRRTRMRPTTLLLSRFGSSDRCITEPHTLSATVLPVRGTAAESGWPRQRRRWLSARRAPTILLHGLPRIRVQRSEGRSAGHGPQARDSRRS